MHSGQSRLPPAFLIRLPFGHPPSPRGKAFSKTKSPEILRPQGRIYIRGTTLLIPLAGNHSSDSNKSYPCNGGTRILLLTYVFTRPTRESDRQNIPHRLTPTAGSLELSVRANFPSLSFSIRLPHYNHKSSDLSTKKLGKPVFCDFAQKQRPLPAENYVILRYKNI